MSGQGGTGRKIFDTISAIGRTARDRLNIATAPRDHVSLLRAGLWLALVLVGAKAAVVIQPYSHYPLLRLPEVSYTDVIFALTLGALTGLAVRAAARQRPAFAHALSGAILGIFTLCAIYAVVSVGVFGYFLRPLTYDLIGLVSDAAAVRSSIGERITPALAVAVFVVPALFLSLAIRFQGSRATTGAALGAAGVWIVVGWWQDIPQTLINPRLIPNPHVELIRSVAIGMTGTRRTIFPQDFPVADTAEFRPCADRGSASAAGFFKAPPRTTRPRNAIVIVMESVGTKYMSLYGSPYGTTPTLDAEAANSMVFDNYYANASHTYYSFRAINFSIYPGLPWSYAPWAGRPMPPSLASLMRARGVQTVYLHNGDLDWGEERWLLRHDGYTDAEGFSDLGCKPLTSWGTEDRCLVDRLIKWIDDHRSAPFFAVCWTDQTHDPYRLGPGVRPLDFFHGKSPAELPRDLSNYLNVLHVADRQLARLFTALRERGLADDTLVVVTGDHGESFRDPHEQRGHGLSVYEEEIKVPLILWNPPLFSGGRRAAQTGAHVDLMPTVADVMGIAPSGGWQGRSLFDPERPSRVFFLTNVGDYLFGVRDGEWKYIFDSSGGKEMLFDLADDPGEQSNRADSSPAQCRRMRQRIAAWVSFEEVFLKGKQKSGLPHVATAANHAPRR